MTKVNVGKNELFFMTTQYYKALTEGVWTKVERNETN